MASALPWTTGKSKLPSYLPNSLEELDQTREAEQVKAQMALRGLNETYYLATQILGFDKLRPNTHGPLCVFLDNEAAQRRLVQMPRSHFKTTIVTVTKRIQDYLRDDMVRILIIGNTGLNVQKHLKKIKLQFAQNPVLRWLYPERCWEDPKAQAPEWSLNAIYLPTKAMHGEPTFDTIGAEGEAASRHYDIINADDLIGEDEHYSETEMSKAIEWFTGLESLFVSPRDGRLDIPCTFWRVDDVYAFAERYYGGASPPAPTGPYSYRRGPLAVFRRGAEENGEPIFPEAISKEFLAQLREHNPERYAAQYANNPYASDVAYFKKQYLKYYQWAVPGKVIRLQLDPAHHRLIRVSDLLKVGLCDPHAGGAESRISTRFRSGGRAAVLMTAVDPVSKFIFILDCWIRQAPTNIIIDELYRQNEAWDPQIFSIEANGLQKMLRYWIDERAAREGLIPIPYEPFNPEGDKHGERRIKGLQPLFRAGQIWMQNGFSNLIEEYLAWPRGAQDGMDALSQGLKFWDVGWEAVEDEMMEEYERYVGLVRSVATGY